MPDCSRLDPRPARTLTTREIAKVLGATIGTMAALFGAERTRVALRAVAQMMRGEDVTGTCHQEEAGAVAILFGQAHALADWCVAGDVLTALDWWINKPGALEAFDGVPVLVARMANGGDRGLA